MIIIISMTEMEKARKTNWTKKEECTLIECIEIAGDSIRGSGNTAEINKKKKALWIDIAGKVNSVHASNRVIEEVKKKWNNLKLAAKSKVNASHREASRTGGGSNSAGVVEDVESLILSAEHGENISNV